MAIKKLEVNMWCSEEELVKLKSLGFRFKVYRIPRRDIDCSIQIEQIEKYLKIPSSSDFVQYLTTTEIADLIFKRSGVKIELRIIGSALQKLGFVKTCKRFDKVPKGVYAVSIGNSREERFKEAQASNFESHGIFAKDFSSADEFNNAVKFTIQNLTK